MCCQTWPISNNETCFSIMDILKLFQLFSVFTFRKMAENIPFSSLFNQSNQMHLTIISTFFLLYVVFSPGVYDKLCNKCCIFFLCICSSHVLEDLLLSASTDAIENIDNIFVKNLTYHIHLYYPIVLFRTWNLYHPVSQITPQAHK